MTKADLLSELTNTYVMLKPSTLEGVGVFAIQSIKKGCRDMFSKPDQLDNWIKLSKKEKGIKGLLISMFLICKEVRIKLLLKPKDEL